MMSIRAALAAQVRASAAHRAAVVPAPTGLEPPVRTPLAPIASSSVQELLLKGGHETNSCPSFLARSLRPSCLRRIGVRTRLSNIVCANNLRIFLGLLAFNSDF